MNTVSICSMLVSTLCTQYSAIARYTRACVSYKCMYGNECHAERATK